MRPTLLDVRIFKIKNIQLKFAFRRDLIILTHTISGCFAFLQVTNVFTKNVNCRSFTIGFIEQRLCF